MIEGVNKVIFVGYVGNDPDIQFLPNKTTVTDIRFFTNTKWNNPVTDREEECIEWNRVIFCGRLAEIAFQYLREGSKTYIEGRLLTSTWQGVNGVSSSEKLIIATSLEMLDDRNQSTINENKYRIQSLQREYSMAPHCSLPAHLIFETLGTPARPKPRMPAYKTNEAPRSQVRPIFNIGHDDVPF